jgi:hypothetical protein
MREFQCYRKKGFVVHFMMLTGKIDAQLLLQPLLFRIFNPYTQKIKWITILFPEEIQFIAKPRLVCLVRE